MDKTALGESEVSSSRNSRFRTALLLASAGAWLVLPATPCFPQTPPATSRLDEVVVTAQKVEQNIQEVPLAITALSGETLGAFGVTNAEQLGAQVPGLISTSYSGGGTVTLFSVRGVAQNDFAEHQEGPVAVYADGVYIPSTSAAGAAMFDISRVEVLKGPQGTLFGRNATGGLIHMIGNKPTEQAEGYLDLTVGDFDQVTLEGAYGGPVSDNLLARVSFLADRADGFFRNLNPDGEYGRARESYNGRLALRFLPSDSVTLDFVARFANDPTSTNGVYDSRPSDGTRRGVPSPVWGFLGLVDDTEPNEGFILSMGYLNKESTSYELTGTFDFGFHTFTSITAFGNNQKGYAESESNEGIVPGVSGLPSAIPQYVYRTEFDQDQLSQELRINGELDRLRYQAGLYYLNIDGGYVITSDFPFFGGRADINYSLETTSWSAFGQVEYDLTDSLSVILGARYVVDEKDYANDSLCVPLVPAQNNLTGFPDCAFFTSGDPDRPYILDIPGVYEDSRRDNLTAVNFTLNYQAADDVLLYAGINRGVKAGGFAAPLDGFIFVDEIAFEPETLLAYQAGMKSRFWDQRAQLNADVFYYDYDDYHAFVYNGISSKIANAQAEMYGGEVELVLMPAEGWYVAAGVAVLESEVSQVPAILGDPSSYYPKQDMPIAPELTLNMILRKSWQVGNGGHVGLQWDGNYVGEQTYSANGSPTTVTDSYSLWNARLIYTTADERWEGSVFVRNVFDEDYGIYAFDLSGSFGVSLEIFGPPRWWGASVRYRF